MGGADKHREPVFDGANLFPLATIDTALHRGGQNSLYDGSHRPTLASVPSDLQIHELQRGDTRVEVAIGGGGRLAGIDVAGTNLLAPRPDEADPNELGWGSFPMAPWVGRIRHGRFRFLGTDVNLDLNHQDGPGADPARRHAIHGTVFHRQWKIRSAGSDAIELACELGGALGWPYGGMATQRISLGDGHLVCELSISATGAVFPGALGWHPWFPKPRELRFSPVAMYRRDSEIKVATGELIVPPAPPWDDCFVNTEPVTLVYDRSVASEVTVTSDCDHWVIYDEPATTTCVEPQSGPPDSPNLRPRVVTPTHPLTRHMTITWT